MLALRTLVILSLPFAHLASAKGLWSSTPANYSVVIQEAYPVGNGRLAALPFGPAGQESLSLNRDSLWTGGPFENSSYIGGNTPGPVNQYLPGIRDWIWKNGTGNVSELMGSDDNYGSYAVLANLSVAIAGIGNAQDYNRSLSFDTGVHTTSFKSGDSQYTTETYCSYPDDVCVYSIASTKGLPRISLSMENAQLNSSLVTPSCSNGQVRLAGQVEPGLGMTLDTVTRVVGRNVRSQCVGSTLVIPAGRQSSLTLIIAAGTNYDETHGTAAYDFSFRGVDPGTYVEEAVTRAGAKSAAQLMQAHVEDYSALASLFNFDLPDTAGSAGTETSTLIARYNSNNTAGDPYLESTVFAFGRHLFISSSRDNSLPPNLQGKWAYALSNAWGADYHADVNVQMNHWGVDQTGLGNLQTALWDYLSETWAPRGAETAKLLYNAPGFVAHDEVNIFGHTGMKTGDEYWADYPASAAWLMQQVADHYDYSRNVTWLAQSGYPLLKAVAQFWLSQLQQDQYFHDGTLVVNPCSSPEHGPTTFGCTHYQQLIYQVFETSLNAAAIVSDSDATFTTALKSSLRQLDKGLHIGSWGQVQEWKLDIDVKNDTHRHLSNLIGWFPGWSLSSYLGGYTNATIQNAVATTLWSRGPGIIDSNAGWEKVWRGACWARLNNTIEAYYELRLTIYENWAPNSLSMYSGKDEPFQIDANFGFVGAVLSMLVVDLPQLVGDTSVHTVVLGPAIPAAWGGGSVSGLRIRGGGVVDFGWDMDGLVTKATLSGRAGAVRILNKDGTCLVEQ